MSLVLTLMQSLRSKYQPETLDKNERRQSRYGVWDFHQQEAARGDGIMTPAVKALVDRSFGNSVVVPVIDSETVSIGNTRTCTISNSENTSKLVTLTFATYSFGFTMTPAQHYNNDVGYQADFDVKMKKYLLAFAAALDTAAANNLETVRNSYFPAAITKYYPNVGNALQVTQAQRNDFFNKAGAIMEEMDYYDQTHVVGSTSLKPIVRRDKAQGPGNQVNNDFQYDDYMFHNSNRVTNAVGNEATGYLVNQGSVAVRNRNTPDAIANARTGNGKVWGQVMMPIVNLNMGSYYYDDCADMNALHAGTVDLTATRMEGFRFDTDICFMNFYNSDAANQYSPVVKFEVSAT